MAHALLCWDIVTEGVARQKEFKKDLHAIAQIMKINHWHVGLDRSVADCLSWENKTILVTNPALQMILASENIYPMNGYSQEEVVGRHPKMFRGEATTAASKFKIKTAAQHQEPFLCDIFNYRKDGRCILAILKDIPSLTGISNS